MQLRRHKLAPPPGRAGLVRRDALIARLCEPGSAPVVLLQGPAGHGKTTTLEQVARTCEERGARIGWLTLDEADNDGRRLFAHLQALVAGVIGGDAPGNDHTAGWLVDALTGAGHAIVLVFDNFQVLESAGILAFFRALFAAVPGNVRIFLGSRNTPDVGFARLVVNGVATVLHAPELRFSRTEVERFFAAPAGAAAAAVALSRDELESIYRRCEGWPAALQLFRLTLGSPSVRRSLSAADSRAPRELSEYLAENVLGLQPPDVQDFLLRTSLLFRLSPPLCDYVTGRADSHERLPALERSGLFLSRLDGRDGSDGDAGWYQYHGLFSSFLAEQLRERAPAEFAAVHARAARWHLEHGEPEEVVRHALACGDVGLAADAFNRWASSLVAQGQIVTVERWYDQLPFAEIARRPDLAIKAGYALAFLRRRSKLLPLLAHLDGRGHRGTLATTTDARVLLSMAAICTDDVGGAFALVEGVDVDGHDQGFAAFERAAASNLLGFQAIALGELDLARTHLARARAHNQAGEAAWSGGYTEGLFGVLQLTAGQLEPALASFAAALAEQRMHLDASFAVAALASCYVWALYEADQLEAAEAVFGRYRELIAQSVIVDFFAVAYVSMARVATARGQTARAAELLDDAEVVAHANAWERLRRLIAWERVRRALADGDAPRARARAEREPAETAPPPWSPFSDDLEGEAFGRIRLAIAAGELAAAEARLKRELAQKPARIHRRIKLLVLSAQLQRAKGMRTATQRALRQALQLAAPGGFVRAFLDEGERLVELEEELVHGGGDARLFVARVSGAVALPAAAAAEEPSLTAPEALSDREKEILKLVAAGVSNRDIGSTIFISENTVKYHLKNIYSKLAVAGRVQAIEAARRLGVIS